MSAECSMGVRWLGAAHFQIESPQGRICFDPWIDGNPGCPIRRVEEVSDVLAVVVGHGHPGHFGRGDAAELALATGAPFVAPTALARYVVGAYGMPRGQVVTVEVGERVEVGPVEIEAFEVPHPPVRDEFTNTGPPGEPNFGYVARLHGRILLHIGDTTPDPVYSRIAENGPVDVAMLPLWAKEMIWTEEQALHSMLAVIADLEPRVVIPHARFRPEVETATLAATLLADAASSTTVAPMKPGELLPVA